LGLAGPATREAERARAVERFLATLFERADPTHTAGERLTGVQLLDEGARRVATELRSAPYTQARMELVLAASYRGLGRLNAAVQHAVRAVELHDSLEGPASAAAAEARLTLAEVRADLGELDAAEQTLERLRPHLADEPRVRARLLVVEGFLAAQRGDLPAALTQAGAAARALEQALGPDALEAVIALESLGIAQGAVGDYPAALATLDEVQARLARIGLGASPQSATLRANRGDLLETVGRLDEAEADFREAIRILEKAYGDAHPELAQALLKFGFFLSQRRRLDDSDAALQHAAAILEPFGHYDLASAWRYLGHNALARERYADAEQLYSDAATLYRQKLGADHNLTWNAVLSLALARARLGRLAEAEQMQRDALAAIARLDGADSPELRAPLKQLGETLRLRGRIAEALGLHRQALALERRSFGTEEHIAVATSKRQIALDLLASGAPDGFAEAGPLLDEALAFLRSKPSERARLPEFLHVRALVYQAQGDRTGLRRALDEGLKLAALEPTASPSAVAGMKRLLAQR
jgi:serine/threonine-protein kinase